MKAEKTNKAGACSHDHPILYRSEWECVCSLVALSRGKDSHSHPIHSVEIPLDVFFLLHLDHITAIYVTADSNPGSISASPCLTNLELF